MNKYTLEEIKDMLHEPTFDIESCFDFNAPMLTDRLIVKIIEKAIAHYEDLSNNDDGDGFLRGVPRQEDDLDQNI